MMDNELNESEATQNAGSQDQDTYLDDQYAELIETVFACEKSATQLDRIDSAIEYGRKPMTKGEPAASGIDRKSGSITSSVALQSAVIGTVGILAVALAAAPLVGMKRSIV